MSEQPILKSNLDNKYPLNMARDTRKPFFFFFFFFFFFAYAKTKTQTSCAVHRLCFRYADSIVPLLPKYPRFQALSHFTKHSIFQ